MQSKKLIRFTSMAAVFTSPPIAGAVLGHLLDEHFHTDPWLTIILLIVGFIDGTFNLVKAGRAYIKESIANP
jgi:F0F1-type ATP synthase assembly protein I